MLQEEVAGQSKTEHRSNSLDGDPAGLSGPRNFNVMGKKQSSVLVISSSPPQPESDGRRNLAKTPRVQRYLGVSRSTLMRYIADRKIEAIKMDGGWRFRWDDVERFIQRRTQKAA